MCQVLEEYLSYIISNCLFLNCFPLTLILLKDVFANLIEIICLRSFRSFGEEVN